MIRNKNLFYYLGVTMVMLLMHKGYALADLHQLHILLQPVAFLVGFTSGSPVIFVPSEGFFSHLSTS